MLIYSRDWFNPTPALVARLAEKIPTLIAWKDGQADLRRFQAIQNVLGDRLHWIGGAGDDMIPGYYSIGIRTYTSSIANVAPKLSLHLHELASKGHSPELTKLMSELVVPLYVLRGKRKGYEVSAMKAMMDLIPWPAARSPAAGGFDGRRNRLAQTNAPEMGGMVIALMVGQTFLSVFRGRESDSRASAFIAAADASPRRGSPGTCVPGYDHFAAETQCTNCAKRYGAVTPPLAPLAAIACCTRPMRSPVPGAFS